MIIYNVKMRQHIIIFGNAIFTLQSLWRLALPVAWVGQLVNLMLDARDVRIEVGGSHYVNQILYCF